MGRKKTNSPKLDQCSSNSCFYFRRYIDGEPMVVSTGTTDRAEAEEFLKNYMAAETAAEVLLRQGENAPKVAQTLIKAVSGQELERLSFQAAWEFWESHNPDFSDNSQLYQEQMKLYFSRFAKWCEEQKLSSIDEVNASVAIRYCGILKSKNMAPATFNENRKLLSRVFACIDAFKRLPHGNVFDKHIVKPQHKPPVSEATHQPLEPHMMTAVLNAAAEVGQDWLDFFIVGAQTGMRLKDAALFRWNFIKNGFIEFQPEKTIKHGSTARLPVSPTLAAVLKRRKENQNPPSPYVNPIMAQFYLTSDWPSKKSKEIFETALGKETTQLSKEGRQRQRNGCIYSFHSFRVTLMSLLAAKQTPIRDAMTIFGWESMEMVKLYTKMLEQARGDMDKRNRELFDNLGELQFSLPEVKSPPERLKPTKEALEKLVVLYSNQSIGMIYDISNVAVKNWMVKFGIVRTRRIIDNGLPEDAIIKIREELQAA